MTSWSFSEEFEDREEEEEEEEEEEILEEEQEEEERVLVFDVNDVAFQLKYGKDAEFEFTLDRFSDLINDKLVQSEWVLREDIVPILLNRLGSSKQSNRFNIILALRSLASQNEEIKENMADVWSLSMLVRSMARDIEERREAVALLLVLSDIPAVRRRIGRIQGCIVMLVALVNGDDTLASHDAEMLLGALSSNTQDVLNMAEAGYFKPLVQHLKEGSDMSKILMATALSRMELTDQSKAVLGDEGSIESLVRMFNLGKLEAKLSALGALRNLSSLRENVKRLIKSGIVEALLQLLFSITSVFMTLREPASAILASIAQSEYTPMINQDVAKQMLSLLNLSSPVIQYHLLRALNSIASHSSAFKVRAKMKENGAIQILLPFLMEKAEIRTLALTLLYIISKDFSEELTEQLGETYLNVVVSIVVSDTTNTSENGKAAAAGLLSNIPVSDKKATEILKKANLLPILLSLLGSSTKTSSPTSKCLVDSIAGVLVRFTVPWDKNLQKLAAERGVLSVLVKLLSTGSAVAKCRAATSLLQLSQNSLSLIKSRPSRWSCVPPSSAYCEVHDGYCSIKSTFCLVRAGAISPLVKILQGEDRDADEAVLGVLATLMQDKIWENGSNAIAKASGVQAIIRVIRVGNAKVQEKALWMLERIFRVEAHRIEHGESTQVLLVDLAQKGDPKLKPAIAKILAHLELLQMQSSYF